MVEVVGRDHVVARFQRAKNCRRRRRTRRETGGGSATLEGRKSVLEGFTVWIICARVDVAVWVRTVGRAFKGRGEVNGWRDSPRRHVGFGSGVNRERLEL